MGLKTKIIDKATIIIDKATIDGYFDKKNY
jgi:hypothetical protein